MKDPFRFKDWVEEFRAEVEAELKRPKPPLAHARDAATPAVEGFKAWWATEHPDGPEPPLSTLSISKELEVSRKELAELRAEVEALRGGPTAPAAAPERLRELGLEKVRLEERLHVLEKENASLRGLADADDEQMHSLRLRLATTRSELQAKVEFLEQQAETLQRHGAAMEAELRDTRERRLQAEGQLQEHLSMRNELQALRSEVQLKLESAAEFLEQKIRGVQEQSTGQMQGLQDLLQALQRLRSRQE